MRQNIVNKGLILGGFALVTTGLIALTYALTRDTIVEQERRQLLSTLNEIIDHSTYDNEIHTDCTLVGNEQLLGNNKPKKVYRARWNDEPVAVAIETTAPDGYNGEIQILVGIKAGVRTTGVRVLKHQETPGLGDKIDLRVDDWILSFDNRNYSSNNSHMWTVKKDGGQFDQFTGATITPRAVVNAVKNSLEYFKSHEQELFSGPNNCLTEVIINE